VVNAAQTSSSPKGKTVAFFRMLVSRQRKVDGRHFSKKSRDFFETDWLP
jgi:hypothetical protein